MKTIIAGSRTFRSRRLLDAAMAELGHPVTEVVSGAAAGADRLGEDWARDNGIPVTRFPALWKLHGKAAGPVRNREMADHADAAVVFWDGVSRGSANMIGEMKARGKPVKVVPFSPDSVVGG